MQWPLSVTLTSKNTLEAAGSIRSFRKSLFALRRTPFWKSNVKGGVLGMEVTNTGHGWHVHAHLLIDCEWLALKTERPRRSDSTHILRAKLKSAHRELSAQWASVLHQPSAVVWVERKWGKALLETIKYAVKPSTLMESPDPLPPLLREMHRLKMVNGFGNCFGLTKKWEAAIKAARGPCCCPECNQEASMIPTDILNMKLRAGHKYI